MGQSGFLLSNPVMHIYIYIYIYIHTYTHVYTCIQCIVHILQLLVLVCTIEKNGAVRDFAQQPCNTNIYMYTHTCIYMDIIHIHILQLLASGCTIEKNGAVGVLAQRPGSECSLVDDTISENGEKGIAIQDGAQVCMHAYMYA